MLVLTLRASTVLAQQEKSSLTVEGEVVRRLDLTLEVLTQIQQTEVRAKDKDGKEHVFKGVKLVSLLDSAGVTLGKALRGKNLTKYVLIQAADGYQVVFSLAEVDPEFSEQTILLAYRVDGNPLPKGEGPIRLVVPGDKKPTRWVREVTSIKVLSSKE